VRQKWLAILVQAFTQQFGVQTCTFGIGLARIQISVRTQPGQIPAVRRARARRRACLGGRRRWDDDLKAAIEASGEGPRYQLLRRFAAAFPAGYRAEFGGPRRGADVELMRRLQRYRTLGLHM